MSSERNPRRGRAGIRQAGEGGVAMAKHIDRQGVRELVGSGAQLVDVLPEKEYAAEHIPGAVRHSTEVAW